MLSTAQTFILTLTTLLPSSPSTTTRGTFHKNMRPDVPEKLHFQSFENSNGFFLWSPQLLLLTEVVSSHFFVRILFHNFHPRYWTENWNLPCLGPRKLAILIILLFEIIIANFNTFGPFFSVLRHSSSLYSFASSYTSFNPISRTFSSVFCLNGKCWVSLFSLSLASLLIIDLTGHFSFPLLFIMNE